MADPNLVDFYGRVARFERARANGYGFDAAGTLGRSHFEKKPRPLKSWHSSVLLVIFCVFGMKAAILHSVGGKAYDNRVAGLQSGQGFDRLGGWLMQADPVTGFVAEKIGEGLAALK